MSAVKQHSASTCQYSPPLPVKLLTCLPKQLYSLEEELIVLFGR
jgi:hypothetical protein